MRTVAILLLAAALAMVSSASSAERTLEERVAAIEQKIEGGSNIRAYWKEGLRLDSQDGAFKLQIGGRVYLDWVWMDSDDFDGFDDGVEFRAARFFTSGTIYDTFGFKLEVDFAGDKVTLKDAYVAFKDVPVLNAVKVGHFKEPFRLEELTSSRFITFMERSVSNLFAPGRNTGVMAGSPVLDNRMTWAAGIFRETSNGKKFQSDDGYAVTGRLTGTPWYQDKGEKLVHLGAAASFRTNHAETVEFAEAPEMHLAPDVLDTGDIHSDEQARFGLEGAVVVGPLAFQGEYMHATVDRDAGGSLDFGGFYAQAGYFLTGEHRVYDPKSGSFKRVHPKRDFRKSGGVGAWEVAARYSHLDLSDDDIDAGELDDVTLGINWYLNPNARMMFNYIAADVSNSSEGDADMAGVRFQVDF